MLVLSESVWRTSENIVKSFVSAAFGVSESSGLCCTICPVILSTKSSWGGGGGGGGGGVAGMHNYYVQKSKQLQQYSF